MIFLKYFLLLLLILSIYVSAESINPSAKVRPSYTLALQSPHFHSPLVSTLPFLVLSHLSQLGNIPLLHDFVTEKATPAEVIACMKAVSFVPAGKKDHVFIPLFIIIVHFYYHYLCFFEQIF